MHNLDGNAHSVFLLHYHLVMVVKYRRKVIDDRISDRARQIFEYIAPNYGIVLEEWNQIREKLWKEAFWSQSFCLLTTGGVTVEVVRQYIESQGEKKRE